MTLTRRIISLLSLKNKNKPEVCSEINPFCGFPANGKYIAFKTMYVTYPKKSCLEPRNILVWNHLYSEVKTETSEKIGFYVHCNFLLHFYSGGRQFIV